MTLEAVFQECIIILYHGNPSSLYSIIRDHRAHPGCRYCCRAFFELEDSINRNNCLV